MLVSMVVVVAVVMLGLWSGCSGDISSNEFVQKVWLACAIGDEAHADLPNTANLCADSLADEILDRAGLFDCPSAGHTDLDIHQVVLAGLDALYRSNLDLLSCSVYALQCLGSSLCDVLLHLVLHANISQFVQRRLCVAPASLYYHERDDQPSDGI